MKRKLKNIICSLVIAFAMLLSSNFSLALCAVNGIRNISFAAYEPTDFVTPYEFTSTSGWSDYHTNNQTLINAFDKSNKSVNLIDLEAGTYKPSTKYDKTSTTLEDGETSTSETDNYAMRIEAIEAPVYSEIVKKDDNGNTVYVKDTDGVTDKIFTEKEDGVADNLYEAVEGGYKRKDVEEVKSIYYYKTTSSLSLKANSWYVVTAWVWTKNADATIIVSGTDFKAVTTAENTDGAWEQHYIFLETSSDSTNSVNISIYYGYEDSLVKNPTAGGLTTGAIFVDNVCVKNISETDYNNRTIAGESNAEAVITSYSARFDYDISYINGDFEDNIDFYSVMYGETNTDGDSIYAPDYTKNNYYQYYINQYAKDSTTEKLTDKELANLHKAYKDGLLTYERVLESTEFETTEEVTDDNGDPVIGGDGEPQTEVVPAASTFGSNNHILKLENKSEKYSLGLLSAPIKIEQFGYYRFSIYVKGTSASDNTTIKLISYIKTGASSEEGAIQVKEQSVTAYTTNSDITNNWAEISFYIQGNCYYDTTFQIALIADTESTVYFDEMRLENISSKTYSNTASAKKFDLSPSATTISGSITNGYFNTIETTKADPDESSAPYTPANWTKLDDSSEDVKAGIVSTATEAFTALGTTLGGAENPITSTNVNGTVIALPKTNVLAMYAPASTEDTYYYGYKSTDFSLSANSVYKITFEVYAATTGDSNFSGDIFAYLVYADNTIAEFTTSMESTDPNRGSWKKYTMVVRTGSTSRTCSIKLGVNDANGTVFFQKVGYSKLSEKTVDEEKISVDAQYAELEKAYNTVALQNENRFRFVNFDGDAFIMHSQEKAEDKDYYSSLSHSLKEAAEGEDPIVQGELGIVDTTANLTLSNDPAYNLESSFMTNPKANSNFAMVIYNSENYNTVVNPNTTISLSSSSYYQISVYVKTKDISEGKGLNIIMDKISVNFSNINTEHNEYGDLSETNGYKKFTVLVKTGSSSISGFTISYELGTENDKFTGTALLTGLNVTKLADEAAYNTLLEDVDATDNTTVIKDFSDAESHSSSEEDADNLTLATFFLVFSSILLVAVLIFAIVMIYIRKIPKTHTVVGKNNSNIVRTKDKDEPTQTDGFV